jgi:peptidyl-prolyl cis-trans isomerase SurA
VVDKIIAVITISLSNQNWTRLQDYITNGGTPAEAKCQYLAMLVRNKLMLAKAEIDSVMVLDAEVDLNTQNRMDMILSQSGKTVDELEVLYGKTMEQVRLELRDQIREQMIVGKMEEEMTKDVKVTFRSEAIFANRGQPALFSASVEVDRS